MTDTKKSNTWRRKLAKTASLSEIRNLQAHWVPTIKQIYSKAHNHKISKLNDKTETSRNKDHMQRTELRRALFFTPPPLPARQNKFYSKTSHQIWGFSCIQISNVSKTKQKTTSHVHFLRHWQQNERALEERPKTQKLVNRNLPQESWRNKSQRVAV